MAHSRKVIAPDVNPVRGKARGGRLMKHTGVVSEKKNNAIVTELRLLTLRVRQNP